MIGIRGDRKQLATLARSNPSVDVAWDRDGALTNRYSIAVCPTVVFVHRGGKVAGSAIGNGIDQPRVLLGKADLILGPE